MEQSNEEHMKDMCLYKAIHKFERVVSCIQKGEEIPLDLNFTEDEFKQFYELLDRDSICPPPNGKGRLSEWSNTFIESCGYSEPTSLVFLIDGEFIEIEVARAGEDKPQYFTQINRGKNDIISNRMQSGHGLFYWYGRCNG